MPVFIDTHEGMNELPGPLRKTVEERVRHGRPDEHGVVDRGVIIDKQSNRIHCVLEAGDVDAVVAHHKSLAVPIERETIHRGEFILR